MLLLAACSGGSGAPSPAAAPPATTAAPETPTTCPLSGTDVPAGVDVARPAVAVKVENAPIAYPLSGLEDAEVVYEEMVEGGVTRFMAIYHCTDAAKVGPVRSARVVDPAIMFPITNILAAAGGNAIVRRVLDKAGVVLIHEKNSGAAMSRIPRGSLAIEHTLYADTGRLRKLGRKSYDAPPPQDIFSFGEVPSGAKKARSIAIRFSPAKSLSYTWSGGRWLRFDEGQPLVDEHGKRIRVDNVIIEEHVVNYSKSISDVAGNRSIDIADVTGSGRAVLFRDGKVIKGRWIRKTKKSSVRYVTADGDDMTLKPGTTWIELVPNKKGELKGSFSYSK